MSSVREALPQRSHKCDKQKGEWKYCPHAADELRSREGGTDLPKITEDVCGQTE